MACYQSVVETANDAIVTYNIAGEVIDWNQAATELYHYTEAEMLGQSVVRLLAPTMRDRFFAELRRIEAGDSPLILGQIVELIGLRKDGSSFPMELSLAEWHNSGERNFTGIVRDGTKRKASEQMILLQGSALSAAANGVVITDVQGSITWVNTAFTTMTGYTLEEAVGKNPRALVKSGKEEPAVYERMWETILAGQTWRGELVNRRKDGSFYSEEQTITPVRDTKGEVTHFIAIKIDCSERKRAEEAQAEANNRYRLLFELSPDGIVIIEPETTIFRDFNSAAHLLLGYSHQEFAQLTIADIEAVETSHQIHARIALVTSIGRSDFETKFRTKLGSIKEVSVTLQIINQQGPPSYHCIWRDITEQRVALRRILEQNEILLNSREGVMIVSLENKVSLWNHGAERIFGWTATEAMDREPEQLVPIDPGILSKLRTALEHDGYWSGEFGSRARDGRQLVVECRTTVVRDDAGQSRARLSIIADITEKRLIEEQFLHAQRLESVGMLAAGIAHDLNNVLAPIIFAAPLLRESLPSPRDLNILNILEKSAERGIGLVKQILGFAQNATGELSPTQVIHLLHDITNVISETFPKSIRLEHRIPADLWLVLGNATQIHQVLLNLCINARDAMPQGGTLTVNAANRPLCAAEAAAIPGARLGNWLMFEVIDTGLGMSPDLLDRIWQPFFTTKGLGKGTGLGLSTVRSIVARHDGFIELQTEVGRGSTFRIFLPGLENQSPPVCSCASAGPSVGNAELIMVVDDEAPIRDMIAASLGTHNYRVARCSDGVDALSFFVTHPGEISLVVTDLDMPRLDGAGLSRALLKLEPSIRLVAMSGLSSDEVHGSGSVELRKLAREFLVKPFNAEDLLHVVHRVLHSQACPLAPIATAPQP